MLQTLAYSVTFPTGRSFAETVTFQPGFGAIVGPNESGKSLVVEMIRFCLFGSAALRGTTEDYKTLKAELRFTLRGRHLHVQRSAGRATLFDGEEAIAVGTRPVNLKIVQELGFGLTVFDMACSANQNELLMLGEMKPTERQRAVDSVIGVAILDDLARTAGDEANTLKRTADNLAASIHKPVPPVQPDDYQHSAVLLTQKAALDRLRSEADRLCGWLANVPVRPVAPVDRIGIDSAILQARLDAETERQVHRQALKAELDRIPAAPDVTEAELMEAEQQLDRDRQYRARQTFLTHHAMPALDQGQIEELRERWQAYCNGIALQHATKRKADLLAKGQHVCPNCSHHWPIAAEALEDVDQELAALNKCSLADTKPDSCEADLDRHQRVLDAWNRVAGEWILHQQAPTTPPTVRWSAEEIARIRIGLANRDRRETLTSAIAVLTPAEPQPDHAGMLRQRQHYEAQFAAWIIQLKDFEAWEAEREHKLARQTELQASLDGFEALVTKLEQARIFEQALSAYTVQRAAYDTIAGKVAHDRDEAEDWSRVRQALRRLRLKIKQHLVPSLNRVASSLIFQMTGGARQTITVDEAFDITVDGQAIDTLSGSGKAVANLALRIGLGQVLTNNVFSVFIGDEIDASMDETRAGNTAGVLRTLTQRMSQMLLVSHKRPAADYYVMVGEEVNTWCDKENRRVD